MKLAVIAPPHYIGIIRDMELGYHFTLGQELVRDAGYRALYGKIAAAGNFIIVDNGAAEPEEERLPFQEIAAAAELLKADEIILPDKLRDSAYTMEHSTSDFIMDNIPRRKRFIVPQGRDWVEWKQCLHELVLLLHPATIGLPKWLEELEGGRPYAMRLIMKHGYHERFNIHMLGIYAKPIEEAREVAKVFPEVRGIDTGAPIAYAQNSKTIADDEHFSLDWRRTAPVSYVKANIRVYNELLMYMGNDNAN